MFGNLLSHLTVLYTLLFIRFKGDRSACACHLLGRNGRERAIPHAHHRAPCWGGGECGGRAPRQPAPGCPQLPAARGVCTSVCRVGAFYVCVHKFARVCLLYACVSLCVYVCACVCVCMCVCVCVLGIQVSADFAPVPL